MHLCDASVKPGNVLKIEQTFGQFRYPKQSGYPMAHENKVMKSINAHDSSICVDIFRRPDGTFGFEEYRRDLEDAMGWFQ